MKFTAAKDALRRHSVLPGDHLHVFCCGFPAPHVWSALLNGIGYGIASTATSTIVSAMIPEERRGEGINYYALSMSLAAAIGPFLGMMMQQFFSFRIIIMFCVAVVLACLAAAFVMKVDEIRITEERRAQLKEISLSSFLEPKVMGIAIVGFFVALCYSSVLSFLATYASELHLMTAGTLFFVVYALSVTIVRPVAGVMFDKKGEDFVMYPTFLCLAVGLLLLSITTRSWEMLVAGVFVGLGYGTFMSNGQAICVKLVDEVRIGVAVSTYFVMLDLGLGVGPYILGAFKGPLGFSGIYSLVGVGSAACAFLYYGLYAWRRNLRQSHEAGSVEKHSGENRRGNGNHFLTCFLWSFPSGVGRWRFKAMGNSLRKVSCPALNSWDSSPQETFFQL